MSSSHINPIIPGFAPDPSVVLVDDTFFLVNSTFHLFPGLPIYVSKDLTSWKHIGNAINRQSQLSLAVSSTRLSPPHENGDVMLATGGLYAPTIRYQNGTFYVVCTNVIHDSSSADGKPENFIVSSRNIWSNEWSDAIYFDFNGIDPSLFFDDNGRAYIQGSAGPGPMTKIHLFEVDLKTGKKLSEEKNIWDGTGGIYPEGPHIYKKDGLYYLLISEGGTHDDHMITVARSKDIWGPYDSFEKNPILTARGTDEYIQYTGHSDMFQDQHGRWWGVCLGVRKDESRYIMGRETFLTTGEWLEGEWPSLKQVKSNPKLPGGTELVRSDGTLPLTAESMVDYLYIRDAVLSNHKFSNGDKTIILTASKADISQWEQPVTFVGKRQRRLKGNTMVTMHTPPISIDAHLKAGIAYYKDEHRYMKLFYDFSATEMVFEVVNNAKKISRTVRHDIQLGDVVALRIEYTERSFQLSYRNGADSAAWIGFDGLDTLEMTGPDFVGPVIGIFAIAEAQDAHVQFDDLEIDT
ncbi:hypothetical protein V502_03535 [Pseudogymnoascus sp. VKM F-4520 (FW-2644)]|nr:hypothetical protein V502_03535 [Pseudogymnoascus sp. VKM F-4520 (FW-2644)]